jgi:hypothetical protein
MLLEFSGQGFEFEGDEFKAMFPLSYGNEYVTVSMVMVPIGEEDILGYFNCGDVVNEVSQLMASADCDAPPSYKLTVEIFIETEGEEKVEMGTCTAAFCKEHSFVGMLQVLFMSGLVTAYRFKLGDDE